eukprot:GEMP01053528.1.p1 GENE.GEMP01053528.1~~GEMP01053528.1.p1  ORF type:complete len:312 (+),score=72.69 GEMP01053528.1:356-1291(+)
MVLLDKPVNRPDVLPPAPVKLSARDEFSCNMEPLALANVDDVVLVGGVEIQEWNLTQSMLVDRVELAPDVVCVSLAASPDSVFASATDGERAGFCYFRRDETGVLQIEKPYEPLWRKASRACLLPMNMVCCGVVTALTSGVALLDGEMEVQALLPTENEVSDVCMTDRGLASVSRGPNGEICLWDVRTLEQHKRVQCNTDFTCATSSGNTLFVASSAGLSSMDLRALDYGPLRTYPMEGVGIRLDITSKGLLCVLDTVDVWTLGNEGLVASRPIESGDDCFVDLCCVGASAVVCGTDRLTWYHPSNEPIIE